MGVVENVKDVADLVKKIGDMELYRKIVHLEGEVIDLTREKRQAEQKADELEHKLRLKAVMKFRQPFYFQDNDAVPFCPRCFEKDQAAVHVVVAYKESDSTGWDCPDCKTRYRIQNREYRHQVMYAPPGSDDGPWG